MISLLGGASTAYVASRVLREMFAKNVGERIRTYRTMIFSLKCIPYEQLRGQTSRTEVTEDNIHPPSDNLKRQNETRSAPFKPSIWRVSFGVAIS
jgi:hypothetical protein